MLENMVFLIYQPVSSLNMHSFHSWLLTQTNRGDIVSDIKNDSNFPKDSTDINTLGEYLENKSACDGAIEAWNEFGGCNTTNKSFLK